MTAIDPRFISRIQQSMYDACRTCGADPTSGFFINGQPHRHGALDRIAYWTGRDGKPAGLTWTPTTLTYACWIAGKDDRGIPLPTSRNAVAAGDGITP